MSYHLSFTVITEVLLLLLPLKIIIYSTLSSEKMQWNFRLLWISVVKFKEHCDLWTSPECE